MRKNLTIIAIFIIFTIGMYFVFSRVIKPFSTFLTITKADYQVENIPQRRMPQKKFTAVAKSENPIDWKNWLLATGTSILVYTLKKTIDLFFKKKEKMLE